MGFANTQIKAALRLFGLSSAGYFVSFPKSGRTWFRVMLDDLGVRLVYTHAGSGHGAKVHFDSLSDPSELIGKGKIIFLHRDPRDTVVSGYFHSAKRIRKFSGTISEFIRDPRHGIEKIVSFNNTWLTACTERKDALVVSYEDTRRDTAAELKRILAFLGRRISEKRIEHAVAVASFETMKQREAGGEYARRYGGRLKPRDPSDPESFKVRRGVVGGYQDTLSPDDVEYCATIILRHMNVGATL